MANRSNIIWVTPPSRLAKAVEKYGVKVIDAVVAAAEFIADKMQNDARQNAPWEDRTGNARTGLFGVVAREAAEAMVVLYLSHGHTVFYGQFLEESHGGKYAIIMPTIERNLPELKRMLDDLLR